MSDQPPSGQPPPSYQPPPPSNPNSLIPPNGQRRTTILAGINPRIWVGAGIGIVVIVVVFLLASQPRATDGVNPTQIALEQTSTQNAVIFITQTFLAITPTIDPKIVAIETQAAQLAQGATDQAATNQAIALLPTQTAVVITSPPQVITATPLPPTAQPTNPPQVITATPLPQVAQVLIVTATPQPQLPQPPAVPGNTAGNSVQKVIENCLNYRETGKNGAESINIDVPAGQIAFVDAFGFDSANGGVFVTITGEYHGTHTIRDGALCSGINVSDNYEPVKQQRLSQLGANFTEISLPQEAGNGQSPVWTQGSFNAQSGTLSLGNPSAWVTFQGWDGKNSSSVVHGVIEPGFTLSIPAPFEGTKWTVTGITYEAVTDRAMVARDEVVLRDSLKTDPPLIYIGFQPVPEGYTSTLPSGWNSKRG